MTNEKYDAIGHSLMDYLDGKVKGRFEVVEQQDGTCYPSYGPEVYFSDYQAWDESVQLAINRVEGRTLDIGCGAGRHSLYLQDKGIMVTAIDVSPLAIEVCKKRGVADAHTSSIEAFNPGYKYNSMLLFGNNIGLASRLCGLSRFLTRLNSYLQIGGTVVGDCPNVDMEMEFRIWYKTYVSHWIEWVFVSPNTLSNESAKAGFELVEIHHSKKSSSYTYVLKKTQNMVVD